MKLLITKQTFSENIGGAETDLIDLVRILPKYGYELFVLTNSKVLTKRLSTDVRCAYMAWPTDRGKVFAPIFLVSYIIKSLALIKEVKPDAIVCIGRDDYIALALSKWLHRRPLYLRDHADIRRQEHFETNMSLFAKLYRSFYLHLLKNASAIITASDYDIQYLSKIIKNKNIVSLHSGIDTDVVHSLRKPNPDNVTVGVVSRLVRDKGIEHIIAAMAGHSNTRLIIVGDGEYRSKLESLADELGVQTKFTGFQSDISKYYEQMDVFVQASSFEGWSRSISEALAHGCCVLASDIPTQAEQLESGKYGVLFDLSSEKDLALKLSELISNPDVISNYSALAPDRAKEIAYLPWTAEQLIKVLNSSAPEKTPI